MPSVGPITMSESQLILLMIPLWGIIGYVYYVLIKDTFPPDRPSFA